MAADLSRVRIAILGCGAVGTAFARGLLASRSARGRGFRGELALWSRSPATLRRCLRELARSGRPPRQVQVARSPAAAAAGARVLLLAVADDAVERVARSAGLQPAPAPRPILLVASGSAGLARLRSRLGSSRALGRLHPLVPVLAPPLGSSLRGQPFGIEGDARALAAARALTRLLDGRALVLAPGKSARYHAGASLLGGGLVALWALAEELMAPATHSRAELREALELFVLRNAENLRLLGAQRALTGALSRGAGAVLRGHLRALRGVPGAVEVYRELGRSMLRLARERGSIDATQERALRRLLEGTRRPRAPLA